MHTAPTAHHQLHGSPWAQTTCSSSYWSNLHTAPLTGATSIQQHLLLVQPPYSSTSYWCNLHTAAPLTGATSIQQHLLLVQPPYSSTSYWCNLHTAAPLTGATSIQQHLLLVQPPYNTSLVLEPHLSASTCIASRPLFGGWSFICHVVLI